MMTDGSDELGGLSPAGRDRVALFEGLVRKWNPAVNLVSRASLADVRQRHVLDSLQLYELAPAHYGRWTDLGSGGGFPGIIIGIRAEEDHRSVDVSLVEADVRKATFLRESIRELGLKCSVMSERIEKIAPMNADVLSARALAPLSTLCAFAQQHLSPDGLAIFPKGATWEDEVAVARKDWVFDLEVRPSATGSSGAVLLLRNIKHV